MVSEDFSHEILFSNIPYNVCNLDKVSACSTDFNHSLAKDESNPLKGDKKLFSYSDFWRSFTNGFCDVEQKKDDWCTNIGKCESSSNISTFFFCFFVTYFEKVYGSKPVKIKIFLKSWKATWIWWEKRSIHFCPITREVSLETLPNVYVVQATMKKN